MCQGPLTCVGKTEAREEQLLAPSSERRGWSGTGGRICTSISNDSKHSSAHSGRPGKPALTTLDTPGLRLLVLLTRLSPVFPAPLCHLPPKAAWEWESLGPALQSPRGQILSMLLQDPKQMRGAREALPIL